MAHHWELISETTYIYTPLRTVCFIQNLSDFSVLLRLIWQILFQLSPDCVLSREEECKKNL